MRESVGTAVICTCWSSILRQKLCLTIKSKWIFQMHAKMSHHINIHVLYVVPRLKLNLAHMHTPSLSSSSSHIVNITCIRRESELCVRCITPHTGWSSSKTQYTTTTRRWEWCNKWTDRWTLSLTLTLLFLRSFVSLLHASTSLLSPLQVAVFRTCCTGRGGSCINFISSYGVSEHLQIR